MINVHISPWYDHADHGDGGIRRVVEAEIKHLEKFGIKPVKHPGDADIIQNHGAMLTWKKGVPLVSTGHGLYWSRQPWGEGYQEVNEQVTESMIRAVAHTVPSEWVARAVRRGGLWYPEVIYHGVDYQDFAPGMNGGYVLWNKARADFVSNPDDLMRVAQMMPNVPFWTTIGRRTENVKTIGVIPYEQMKGIIANAGVYLCTARETFGIGTLEAMASGVPVAGWNWGGQAEVIRQGETGYLAPPGDFQALSECIARCLEDRDRLEANCLDDVRVRWKWEPRIEQYANLFKRVYAEYYETKRPKVSVIITAYKLDQYLPMCIESVQRQTFTDWECLVIDDAPLESTKKIVKSYADDSRIRYCPVLENLGLPGARNYGHYLSRGRYIRHLDADDYLAENALALEVEGLDNDPSVHIVYGHLETTREDGSRILKNGEPVRSGWPPVAFSWEEQMAHLNQLPSCVMMRREVLERSGGYRTRMKRNEDAEFWCRATSLGFRAKKFTQAVTYFHRQRDDSKGAVEWREQGSEPDWTAWFPWRFGSRDYRQATQLLRQHGGIHPQPYMVPFGAQGRPGREGTKFWYVHDHAYPVVSVVVTVGPGHERWLTDALDSIQAQSYIDWECVVVNDTGKPWGKDIMGAPWAQVVNMDGNQGAAAARNEGYRHTRGKYIVWMDADDYWLPWFLDVMVAHADQNSGVIFSDLIMDNDGLKIYRYQNFDSKRVPSTMQYPGSSVLVPRAIADAVIAFQGGWDSQSPGMEDWDYQMAVHHLGFCAFRVDEPLFVYRLQTSTKREKDYSKIEEIRGYMDRKWFEYRTKRKVLMCGCASTKKVNNKSSSAMSASGNFQAQNDVNSGGLKEEMVQLEYVGPLEETFSIRSRVQPGILYRFGNNDTHRVRSVFLGDAEYLSGLRDGLDKPLYVMLTTGGSMETRDPVAFLAQAVAG